MNEEKNPYQGGYSLGEELEKIAHELSLEGKLWQPDEEIPVWLHERMPDDSNMEEKMEVLFSDLPRDKWPDDQRLLEYINKTRMYWVKMWKAGRVKEGEWVE